MNTVRFELSSANAPEVLHDLVQRYCSEERSGTDEPSVVVDCQALSSLEYAALQDLLRLRGKCIFTGLHKLEACLQRYGISNLSHQLPTYSEQ
jgi:anti-anti-sigma regulatory factor